MYVHYHSLCHLACRSLKLVLLRDLADCILVFLGFVYIPRNVMLMIGLLTAAIGPALVLVLLGVVGAVALCMAFYPICTVAGMWIFFFLQSQFFQRLGVLLDLDVNGDGVCDFWDFLDWVGTTRLGKLFGIDHIHQMFTTTQHSLLDDIDEKLSTYEQRVLDRLESLLDKRSVSLGKGDGRGGGAIAAANGTGDSRAHGKARSSAQSSSRPSPAVADMTAKAASKGNLVMLFAIRKRPPLGLEEAGKTSGSFR